MNLIFIGLLAGVLGTLVMDLLNYLFARAGIISKIDIGMIGRMAAGWTRGHFYYNHPDEVKKIDNEVFYGYLAHYGIGVGFSLPYVLGWNLLIGGIPSPESSILYGIATTAGSWLFIYPSIGQGVCGLRSAEGIRSCLSSLANHLFFGIGMAIALALV
jgi:uncharacterized membrane protein YeaQ/YmgE (transglycosylase-associated protein family)